MGAAEAIVAVAVSAMTCKPAAEMDIVLVGEGRVGGGWAVVGWWLGGGWLVVGWWLVVIGWWLGGGVRWCALVWCALVCVGVRWCVVVVVVCVCVCVCVGGAVAGRVCVVPRNHHSRAIGRAGIRRPMAEHL